MYLTDLALMMFCVSFPVTLIKPMYCKKPTVTYLLLLGVGFSLRKDDPVRLKEVIVAIQAKAASVDTSQFEDQ